MNIIEAIHSKKLFRPCFKDLDTWASWMVLLKALFGLPVGKKELALFQTCTGREKAPKGEFGELWAVIGRRGGKSFIAALIAVFLALFHRYEKHLGPGEVGVIQVIASDRSQAQVILGYIRGILQANPVFAQYIVTDLKESIELSNRISIEVMSCSYKSVRGRTVVCAIFDEISFWRVEGANPDKEILAAIRPSMVTIPNSKLIVISSPYAQYGILWETFKAYFGSDNPDVLVWKAPTRTMNPTIPESLIQAEEKKDAMAARSEWEAEFREDLELFLSREAVESCAVLPGPLAPRGQFAYRAFVDPSGGRNDSFTLAIGHQEKGKLVCDFLKAWEPPFDPQAVVKGIAEVLGQYRVDKVIGDRYGAAWVESAFEKVRVRYQPCDKPKSDLYLNLEGFVNTGMIEIPKDGQLIGELTALERRRGKAGKDTVDHPPRGNDDRANAVAGLCYEGMKAEDLLFPVLRLEERRGNALSVAAS
jgi:hypothetical protein